MALFTFLGREGLVILTIKNKFINSTSVVELEWSWGQEERKHNRSPKDIHIMNHSDNVRIFRKAVKAYFLLVEKFTEFRK